MLFRSFLVFACEPVLLHSSCCPGDGSLMGLSVNLSTKFAWWILINIGPAFDPPIFRLRAIMLLLDWTLSLVMAMIPGSSNLHVNPGLQFLVHSPGQFCYKAAS